MLTCFRLIGNIVYRSPLRDLGTMLMRAVLDFGLGFQSLGLSRKRDSVDAKSNYLEAPK